MRGLRNWWGSLWAFWFWSFPAWVKRESWRDEDTVIALFVVVLVVLFVLGVYYSLKG
jgi:hypothetical protein